MASISWLHLTDFHCGMTGQRLLWPDVHEAFYDDLPRLHAKSGPWDLVLFTGDLTQRGSATEFTSLGKTLDALWTRFRELGSDPALVVIPGNHDLARPDAKLAEVAALARWNDDDATALRARFWSGDPSPERDVVRAAFAEYVTFRDARMVSRDGFMVRHGVVPGDVSVSVERDGLRLALVGLNSAFLHLRGGDLTGELALEREQLQGVCGDDYPTWLRAHDAALLLTHHPRDWLHPRAQRVFDAGILGRDRFLAHLYGHMHEAALRREAVGGSPERRTVQGPSLFGLEHFGTRNESRIHGYMAGRITVDASGGTFRVWPRRMETMEGGHYELVAASKLSLDADDAVTTSFAPRARAKAPPPPVPPVETKPPPGPAGPSRKYLATTALAALTVDRFEAVVAALKVPAAETVGATPMARAMRAVEYLEAHGRLDALNAALAATPAAPPPQPATDAARIVPVTALRKALLQRFEAPARIRMLLSDAGIEVSRIHFAQPPDTLWNDALAEVIRANRLRALLDLACEEYPHADDLRALASQVGP